MRNFLLIFFCFISTVLLSQEYHFDYMLKTIAIRTNPKNQYESFDMINSKNHYWYMEVGKNTISENYYSILIDKDKKNILRFQVSDLRKNPLIFQLESNDKYSDYPRYSFKNLKIESIGKLKYKIYPEQILKPKKQIFEMEVQLEKFEDDLIVINFELLNNEQEFEIENLSKSQLKEENQTGNFYIKEINIKYIHNSVINYKIVPTKVNVNL